ncbi:hypothetical protein BH23CHL4_BH23CHL4_19720 [soil metagenome]
MPVHSIDRLAVSVARGSTRRTFLAAIGTAIGLTAASRIDVQAGLPTCSANSDCDPGLVCTDSICTYPGCADYGEGCTGHGDCCNDFICTSGVCSVSPRCALEGEGCTANGDCCPGMICLNGACGIEPPAPPENTGGGNTGGGGGDGNTGGGGGDNAGGGSGGGTTGTTPGGVSVAALPSTGIGGESARREKWSLAAAALAGTAGLIGLSRRTSDRIIESTLETQDDD